MSIYTVYYNQAWSTLCTMTQLASLQAAFLPEFVSKEGLNLTLLFTTNQNDTCINLSGVLSLDYLQFLVEIFVHFLILLGQVLVSLQQRFAEFSS